MFGHHKIVVAEHFPFGQGLKLISTTQDISSYELVLQFFLPSFSKRVLFQVGVSSCSSVHEDALYVPEQFPQDQLKKQHW